MRLYEVKSWIIEGYKEATSEFTKVDPNAAEVIKQYRDLVNRNQVQGDERNIDYWRKQGYEKFKEFVSKKSQMKSMTQLKRSKSVGESITLHEDENWLVVIPLDKDASCFHGKDTDWCTTKPFQSYFEEYFYDDNVTLVYFIRKSDMNKWAIAVNEELPHLSKYYDKNDKRISEDTFDDQTDLQSMKIIQMVLHNNNHSKVRSSRQQYVDYIYQIKSIIPNVNEGEHTPELEALLIKTRYKNGIYSYFTRVGVQDNYPILLQKLAVNYDGRLIQFIENQSEQIKLDAIKQDIDSLRYIKNPSQQVWSIAVRENGFLIKHIKNPSEEVQFAAVQNHGNAINYIENPSEEVQIAALQNTLSAIEYIKNPSERVQLVAMTIDGSWVDFIKNPSEEVQLAAVKQQKKALGRIKNPTEKVKQLHKELWG